MRFPTLKDGKIDEKQSLEMLNYAYEHGVNYFDTAWPYHDGDSEPFVGKFLAGKPREKIYLATKLPSWLIKDPSDPAKYLDMQLERLQTDYIDYYLLHSLGKRSWQNLKKLGILSFLEKAKAAGKIRHIGFSFHDAYPVYRKIIDSFDWDFCQIMLNYLDTHYQAGFRGYELAVSRGIGVISMEPLRGGKLVAPIPAEVEAVWSKSQFHHKPHERALRWVWDLAGCTVLLSGMSNLEQVKQNIRLSSHARAESLTAREKSLYVKARRSYIKRIAIPCTECRYCMPCPHGVAIPFVFGHYNEAMIFGDHTRHKREYDTFLPAEARADKCVHCGECLPKCPRHIAIPDEMDKIKEFFS